MYNSNSQLRLKEKVDYELWLIGFLLEKQDIIAGRTGSSTLTFEREKNKPPNIGVMLASIVGAGMATEIMNALSPLVFTASYKVIDMVYEWVLEENQHAGNISNVPWRFAAKIDTFKQSDITYPPLFQSEHFIHYYSFALYENLLKFRNEIVHNHNFEVSDGTLKVDTIKDGTAYSLVMDAGELGSLARVTIEIADLLIGNISFSPRRDHLLKYNLDHIQNLHGLSGFAQAEPLVVNVVYKIDEENGVFFIDLKHIRQEISRVHPGRDVLFNLRIVGFINDNPSAAWYFPVDAVPEIDSLEVESETYKEYHASLEDNLL